MENIVKNSNTIYKLNYEEQSPELQFDGIINIYNYSQAELEEDYYCFDGNYYVPYIDHGEIKELFIFYISNLIGFNNLHKLKSLYDYKIEIHDDRIDLYYGYQDSNLIHHLILKNILFLNYKTKYKAVIKNLIISVLKSNDFKYHKVINDKLNLQRLMDFK
mgnify:CR=1 FL=1